MQQFLIIFIILILPLITYSQELVIEAPPPPPMPRPLFNLLPEEQSDYDSIQKQINLHNQQQIILLNNLKAIALNEDTLAIHRRRAVELIGEIQLIEAYSFMLENIDLFIYNPFSTRPQDYENFPCLSLLYKKPYVSIKGVIINTDFLDKCRSEKQLEYILKLLVHNLGNYRFPKEIHPYITNFPYPHNLCKQKNIRHLRELLAARE